MRSKIKRNALYIFLALFSFLITVTAIAQQRRISGKILGSDGKPVAGASITVNGTTTGTQTDASGNFTLVAPQGKNSITISSVGFETQNLTIPPGNTITATLKTSTTNLNEIVVTGYTAQRKKDITGSVSVVSVRDMKSIPSGSSEQLLQGQASGVSVITSGAPGGPSNVFIRGISSFGNSDPLVIIDGIQSSMHDINANDIESVQVLKDAGAASQYGVRGSNGVIVITTKRGSRGKTVVNYDAYYGTQRTLSGNPFHLLNSQELANALWIASKNAKQVGSNGNPQSAQYGNGATPVLPDYITPGGAREGDASVDPSLYNTDYTAGNIYQITKANKVGTDWFHEVFKPAPIQSHTLSVSGGSDKATFLFSTGYFNQQGTLINTYLHRYDVRLNSTFNVSSRIRVGENAYMFHKDNPQIGYLGENVINMVYREQPIIPVYDIKGNYAGSNGPELGNAQNPVANQRRTANNKGYNWDVIGNGWAEVDILNHLTARTSFGGTIDNGYYYYYGYHTYENAENNSNNSFSENSFYNSSWTWTNSLTYNNVIAQKHNLKVFVATEAINYYGRTVGGTRLGYFNDDPSLQVLNAGGATGQTNYSTVNRNTLFSLIGRADYAFNDKYLLSATVRRDGSSVFGSNKRYGVFPAFSAGWRISQEGFLRNVGWLSDLKLRGSWGILGSQNNVDPTNAYTQYLSTPGNSNYDITGTSTSTATGFYLSRFGNLSTGWEQDKVINVGLDGAVLHSKIDFSIEYYRKSITGLLFTDQTTATAGGATRPSVNIGDVQNKGVDVSVNYHAAPSNNFKFNIGANVTAYKSSVVSIPGNYFDAGSTRIGNFVRNQVDHPVSAFFGYKVIGLFKDTSEVAKAPTQTDAAPGRFRYLDADHDGTITDADRVFFGNPNPKFTYGINLNTNYKDFDLTMILYGSQGNDLINYVRYWTDFWASFQGNKSKDLLYNSWTPQNTGAKVPILENASTFSTNSVPNSYYLENGSFLKCKSLIIGYSIPPSTFKKIGITRLRAYLQASNLFTITKYTGLDPEVFGTAQAFGIDYGNYPNNQRMYIVGVNLTF
ncbi:SusC/RagA family TonB-linked outer membrane protein [Segetibacter koreensis]|uniref:SusC/RagA family TonB-linked outer membrane protein n=1 Tax=Segetibacter koreensis TaxID=398037 RepID=UPI000372E789|nr:TonB-dependent receptor [Segetibacter koreensis]